MLTGPNRILPKDEFEEDDTPEEFSSYTGQPQLHNFTDDAVDWVGVFFNSAGTRRFSTSSLGSRADTCITLFAPNATNTDISGPPLASDCDSGPGQSSQLTFTSAANKGYFVRVTQEDGSIGENTNYTLNIDFEFVQPDSFEQDDSPVDFSPYLSQPQQHNFADDTTDWIGIYFGTPGVRQFTTLGLGQNADTCISLFRPNATNSGTSGPAVASDCDSGPGQASRFTFDAPEDSSYFIRVTNQNGLVGEDTEYTFSVNSQ
ncbi:hypothetical protein [Microbulbifer discodermiae]|uniref:hypothetical protein n=1 Tax=Microbulbifer sp. 2201CG32-9 TaxID=3232309 RepID=UPI00345BF51B